MDSLLTRARTAAHAAGETILSHYGTNVFTLKDDKSPVTIADTEAHDAIVRELASTRVPILSEEDLGIPLPYPERLWIIDPLDGTKGFLNHTDDFAVMIALLEEGRPVLAVVYAPLLKKEYYAVRGRGAFLTDGAVTRRLTVSSRTLSHLRGILSINHHAPYMDAVCNTLETTERISIGSVGIKAGYIAEDIGDFYITRGALGEWDVCAPELILTEAGGTATDALGNPLVYGNPHHRIQNGLVFSNGAAHDSVLTALQKTAFDKY